MESSPQLLQLQLLLFTDEGDTASQLTAPEETPDTNPPPKMYPPDDPNDPIDGIGPPGFGQCRHGTGE